MNFKTKHHTINKTNKPYFIAELGLNHNKDMSLLKDMVQAAAAAGANAIKLQSYTTEKFINKNETSASGLFDIFKSLELTLDEHEQAASWAQQAKIDFISTPLSNDWVKKLNDLNVPFFKIASGDLCNYSLLTECLKYETPLIISTGAASETEIRKTMAMLDVFAKQDVIFLHCMSLYPTPIENVNLCNIQWLSALTGKLTGFSDHSQSTDVALAASALGAVVYEKHFTLDKKLDGPDQAMSANPKEFALIRKNLDLGFQMQGEQRLQPWQEEVQYESMGKRSLYKIEGDWSALRPRKTDLPKDSDYFYELVKIK